MSNFNNLIGVTGANPIPKPINPREEKIANRSFTSLLSSQSSNRTKSLNGKLSTEGSKAFDQQKEKEEEQKMLFEEDETKMVQQQLKIACILLNHEQNVRLCFCFGFVMIPSVLLIHYS